MSRMTSMSEPNTGSSGRLLRAARAVGNSIYLPETAWEVLRRHAYYDSRSVSKVILTKLIPELERQLPDVEADALRRGMDPYPGSDDSSESDA